MFCTDLTLMTFIWLGFGMNMSLRINVGYVYLVEMMPKNRQTAVTTAW